ncbi:MAG TPA: hypothetical protein DEG17_11350 [Cyanobacteria bacterium UBA11149]|nr:hypothetical protein [Cyanobacteria bacterium UBA11367]HBE57444.1 hypothetical protein [Cyanobacteria bacterium UBA11366]HBK66078.1 hypothetical protein [Cyanobacteria bacterium UBA11166]HBR76789.1 hypothetical protein [Cyanobacteria bacterium UBA11159]HBS71520.1 hypothetical protein [Cyanobacteria bacterium UBA11153]HBW89442.1 hypothetical protein [Cyanobacteria bacterium UBA11149]HCA97375.1 hypothetical protein [Cyanobacteria bacterium UBA9226]
MTALTVNFNSIINLTDDQFYQLCQDNETLKFERNAQGEIIIMSPVGGETGNRNAGVTAQLWIWNEGSKLGKVFDSSTGFKLPNGADRSPDAAWVRLERWDALTQEQKDKFPPLCPDFAIELLSPSDSLTEARDKMKEYMENGVLLGWLLNRRNRQVEIYRQGQEVEILDHPTSLSGEDILPGFVLNLAAIW